MDPLDREVLALRHFEQLSNAECARVLALSESAGGRRGWLKFLQIKHLLDGLFVAQALFTPHII
jgi:RNA polymerase sigma-70 factor (ECF subfamily)